MQGADFMVCSGKKTGSRVQGVGCRVQGAERDQSAWCRVHGAEYKVKG